MKLQDCIIMGWFMGLDTIDECINNYTFHYVQCLPYKEAVKDALELNIELNLYDTGKLELDWDYINKEVEKQNKELNEYFERTENEGL